MFIEAINKKVVQIPLSESLEKILHVSNEESEKQEAKSNNGHSEKNFPNKIARNLISSQSTDLLHQINHNSALSANRHTLNLKIA